MLPNTDSKFLSSSHFSVKDIPFSPETKEVFYIEDRYDEECNRFIIENYSLICTMLETKHYHFTYLPYVNISKEQQLAMIEYRVPQVRMASLASIKDHTSLSSDFLLQYLDTDRNNYAIEPGFCWFDKHGNNSSEYYFCCLSFIGKPTLTKPDEILKELVRRIGMSWIIQDNMMMIIPHDGSAFRNFDEETRKLLDEAKEKLDKVRLKGISEAVIAKYISKDIVLSHIRIASDFRIFLDDYKGMEIKMEPLVKAVYILFLRHEEGLSFYDLPDYRRELEIIYRAVKKKSNDIDSVMTDKLFTPVICESVKKLTDPFDNSINEKCTRIKEAFLTRFHESMAEKYYITGMRSRNKGIALPHDLIVWE